MRLDPDCIRDVLLTVERHTTYSRIVEPACFIADGLVEKYGEEKLLCYILKAEAAGFFNEFESRTEGDFTIRGLSTVGHEFLLDSFS
ncbi:DUF2513 domain-containing protein [Lacticaseibacillus paracasei]